MFRRLLAAAAAGALALAVAGPALAVTNGTPDGDNHPYVGLLVFDTKDGPMWRCSGALLSPTVVLTAAHCTDGALAARAWFQSDVTMANAPTYPFGGPGSGAFKGTPYVFPDYASPAAGGLPGFSFGDVGIVVLDTPVPTSQVGAYAVLPKANQVAGLANKTTLDYVGFGAQYQLQPDPSVTGKPAPPKDRWAGPRIRNYAPGTLVSGNFQGSANVIKVSMNAAQGKGGTCLGDSGGPDLLGGTNTVLAVNSFVTNGNCSGVGYDTRVDLPERLDWIQDFMQ